MEEKKITEEESISLIAQMISRTKERYIGDGNIMLMWGWLTIAVTGLVWLMLAQTLNPACNWLWFLIPAVGGVATPIMARKSRLTRGVKTYSDRISSQLWTAVGIIALAASALCIGFEIAGFYTWQTMFVFALIVVPLAEITQGIVVREKALVAGGSVGMAIGLVTTCCIVGGIALYAYWFLPVFMLAFLCMMVIPGYVINRKARRK